MERWAEGGSLVPLSGKRGGFMNVCVMGDDQYLSENGSIGSLLRMFSARKVSMTSLE